jgi:hypothetical protein
VGIEAVFDKFMRGEVPVPGKDFCDMVCTHVYIYIYIYIFVCVCVVYLGGGSC